MLSYYVSHSPITDPGHFSDLLKGLPDEPAELTQIVQRLLIHKLEVQLYNIQISPIQRQEQHLRTVQQILGRVQSIDPAPLTTERAPQQRVVSNCRDFAVLFVALARHQGTPARMRVGYAAYLDPNREFRYDHWIAEYWDGSRWVLADPQIDEVQRQSFKITCNTLDLRRDQDFWLAGSAWQLARSGKVKSTLFRFNGHWKGFPCIRGNLLHDLQALNKLELTPMDYWDRLSMMPEHELSVEDKSLLDRTAELTEKADENFEVVQTLFQNMPRTKVIFDKLRTLGIVAGFDTIDADSLQDSGVGRLAQLTGSNGRNGKRETIVPEYQPYEPLPHMTQAGSSTSQSFGIGDIVVRGAQQHNLKRIDVVIPRHRMVVVTGVSGSGKSSLAFDTIYAEGQRRYVESLSSYARQFMEQMEKPKVDQITGLSPAIAIEQKTVSRNPRSTVGTVTEILDYLRVLFARAGLAHCPQCGRAVQPQTAQQITNRLSELPAGTRFQLLAPLARGRKGAYQAALKQAAKDGFTRARVNGFPLDLSDPKAIDGLKLDKNRKQFIELVVDRLIIPGELDEEFELRLSDSVETTLRTGQGLLLVVLDNEELLLSEHNACPHCDLSFPELQPNMFSFNSPFGMCPECNGLGVKLQVDPGLIVEHPEKSLMDGASRWYGEIRKKKNQWLISILEPVAQHYGADLDTPYQDLPEDFRYVLLHGAGDLKFHFQRQGGNGDASWKFENTDIFHGAIHHINRLFRQTASEYTRRWYMSFMSQLPCPKCEGERLAPETRFVTLMGKRLPELTSLSIEALYEWICSLPDQFDSEQFKIASELVEEIRLRLQFLRNVGLHYLALDRPAPTLSGGEGQRIRLASQIGSGLVGVLYILDEPSIGLHTRDHRALLDTLLHLRDIGNTVLVVEHDADTMRCADWILDLGPGPGVLGGRLVSAGTPDDIMRDPDSLTGKYLSGELQITSPNGFVRRSPHGWLTLKGARLHNLKNIDVCFPLRVLTCVTGVSGSGKSSLIAKTLEPALARLLQGAQATAGPYDTIEGWNRSIR
jgi:excinuclease ABC subunit A